MRDPNRIPVILGALGKAWRLSPDLRLGQLIAIVADEGRIDPAARLAALFNIEDEKLLEAIRAFDARQPKAREG